MNKYFIIKTGRLIWKLKDSDKPVCKLNSLQGYSVLNPSVFSKAYLDNELTANFFQTTVNDSLHIITTGIIIKHNSNDESISHLDLFKYLQVFFRYVRFESLHPNIIPNNFISLMGEKSTIKKGRLKFVVASESIYSPLYNTSLQWKLIIAADKKMALNIPIEIGEEILIDAFDSLINSQYSKVILFSAMSIESSLRKYYENFPNKRWQRIKNKYDSHATKDIADPILDGLLKANNFKKLLHEIPIYLMNKSFMWDNEDLYKRLDRLYKTRNKLVHAGEIVSKQNQRDFFRLSKNDADIVFNSAIELFELIGISRFNALKDRRMITLK